MQLTDILPKPAFIFLLLLAFSFQVSALTCGSPKGGMADAHIQMFSVALDVYYLDHGRYISQDKGLAGLIVLKEEGTQEINMEETYLRRLPLDPWGNPYQYRYPGVKNPESYDLWSFGADGVAGGEEVNKDCGNWPGGECQRIASSSFTTFKVLAFIFFLFVSPFFCLVFYVARVLFLKFKGAPWSKARQGIHAKLTRFSLLSFAVTFVFLLIFPYFFMSC